MHCIRVQSVSYTRIEFILKHYMQVQIVPYTRIESMMMHVRCVVRTPRSPPALTESACRNCPAHVASFSGSCMEFAALGFKFGVAVLVLGFGAWVWV